MYELRGPAGALDLVELEVPGERPPHFFIRFLSAPDGKATLSFTRHGIYVVEGEEIRRLWPARGPMSIDVTGHTTPVEVAAWNGLLFATRLEAAGKPRFHLLTPCEP
jgi:hypothetical protein